MTASAYMPDVKVEVAFNAGVNTPAASRTWTDVSAWVELGDGIGIVRGRGDEFAQVQPSMLTLTLDNSDGRFTAYRAASPYYPNVKIGRPIRVTATSGGVTRNRFVGYVEEWPVEWEATEAYARAQIIAVSRLAHLGGGMPLAGIVQQEILRDDPVAYYPLGESSEFASARDISGNGQPPLRQLRPEDASAPATRVQFAGAASDPDEPLSDGVLYDGLPAPILNGNRLAATLDFPDTQTRSVECFFSVPAQVGRVDLIHFGGGGSFRGYPYRSGLMLTVEGQTPPGRGLLRPQSVSNAGGGTTGAVAFLPSGSTHHAALVRSFDTFDREVLTLYIDGAGYGVDTSDAWSTEPGTDLILGHGSETMPVVISHVAVYDYALSAATVARHAEAGLTGFGGDDTPGGRIDRVLDMLGVPADEALLDAGQTRLGPVDSTDRTALDLIREAEDTEGGILFDGTDGRLVFHSRRRRFTRPVSATLSVADHEIESDLAPKLDRSTIVNDITGTLKDGTATVRAVNAASVTDYGLARADIELATTSTDYLRSSVNWRVNRYSEPRPRIPSVTVNALAVGTVGTATTTSGAYGMGDYGDGPYGQGGTGGTVDLTLLDLDIGDRLRLEALPTQAPSAAAEFFVEGYTETIAPESYFISFNVSPAEVSDVWILGDTTRGVLGSTTVLGF